MGPAIAATTEPATVGGSQQRGGRASGWRPTIRLFGDARFIIDDDDVCEDDQATAHN